MKKCQTKRVLKSILTKSIYATCSYYGAVEEVLGAERLTVFIVWASLFLYSCSFHEPTTLKKAREEGPSLPMPIINLYNVSLLILFIWHGWWITAIAYFGVIIYTYAIYEPNED